MSTFSYQTPVQFWWKWILYKLTLVLQSGWPLPRVPLNQGDPPCSFPPWPPGPRQGWAAGSDRFWLRELRVSQHFSTFYGSSVQSMDTKLGARHRRRTPTIHRGRAQRTMLETGRGWRTKSVRHRRKPPPDARRIFRATQFAKLSPGSGLNTSLRGCRSPVDVRVELRQRDLLVQHKLREDDPARGDLKGHHEREVALAGIVRGAAGDFRHRHLTRVVGNDGGHVV